MYVAIRRYDGIEPGAVAEFVRRVTADSGAATPAVEQELDRWAGRAPAPVERAGRGSRRSCCAPYFWRTGTSGAPPVSKCSLCFR